MEAGIEMARTNDTSTDASGLASQPDDSRAVAARLRTALLLFDSGVAMKRAQLRRQDPAAAEEEIARRLAVWLRTRPGALHGDAEGRVGALPDSF